ncbi:MAG: hypothetical protein EOM26_08575 [Alphaproteobacteria bacterium]|nr:hypothetical protein [Alphaproteobacteria bacterium]
MRHYRRRRIANADSGSVASQLMGLSLFVMLLAFFIVLNAISTFHEQKMRPALASVGGAFGSRIDGEDTRPSVTKSDENSIHEGDTLDNLEALFNSHLTGIEVKQEKRWGTMHIRVPADSFMEAVEAIKENALKNPEAAYGDQPFVPTLVSLMQTAEQTQLYRMDMVLGTPDDPGDMQNNDPGGLRVSMEKLAGLAAQLERGGLARTQVSIGMQAGPENTMDLYFRPYLPFSPVGETVPEPKLTEDDAQATGEGPQP